MKIKNKIATSLMIAGALLVIVSLVLLCKNQQIEQHATLANTLAIEEIQQQITDNQTDSSDEQVFDYTFAYEDFAPELMLDSDSYIGTLWFASLDLELAVQSGWAYEKLTETPCVYQEYPLSIAAHNYTAHFGRLSELIIGDLVVLTDTAGQTFTFEVVSNTIVDETDIEQLQNDSYDLTLFTCNFADNSQRVLVRLNLCDH